MYKISVSDIYRKKMKSFTDRKAYTNEKGTNFPNQHRQHQLLAIPFNRMNSADFHISPDHVTNGEPVNNSVGGFAASRLLVKRERSKLNNCTKCGEPLENSSLTCSRLVLLLD